MKDLKYEHQSTNMNTKFWGGVVGWVVEWVIIIFQGVLTKLNLLMKFRHLKKNYIFLHFSVVGRGSNFYRDRYGKPNIYSKNSSNYQVFSSNSQKLSLWCKNKLIIHKDGFYDSYKIPHTIS